MAKKEKKRTSLRIWDFCTSKRLALWLIIILAFLSLLGMLIPQVSNDARSYLEWSRNYSKISPLIEKIQLHKIFKSYIFLIIVLFFVSNLIFCTIEQIKRNFKKIRIYNLNILRLKYPNETKVKIEGNLTLVKKEIINLLAKKRFKTTVNNNILRAEKGRVGIWGAAIFHIGLITIIFGGLISNYFSMSGYFPITEGETFQETHQGYLPQSLKEAPLFNEASGHIGYQLKLDKQERFYKGNNLDYTRSYISAGEKDNVLNTKGIIERGQPFEYKGLTFYHKTSGYSPIIKLKRNNQEMGIALALETKETSENKYKFIGNIIDFENEGYIIEVSYFPDFIIKSKDKYDYNSMEVKNPAINIEVEKNGQIIYNNLVKKNQWVKFEDFELSLGNTIYWVGIDVVKDPGTNVLFMGFIISLLGLIMLYSLVHKSIYLEFKESDTGTVCIISGFSSKYQLNFKDEFKDIITKIESIGVV